MAVVPWPTTAELKQRLDITSDDWDDQLDRLLATAIDQTKKRTGEWVDASDRPDENLAQSALELAVEIATTGNEAITAPASKSRALLYGRRRRFGVG